MKDPSMRIRRNYGGPLMPLKQAQRELVLEVEVEEEEEEERLLIAQIRARRKRDEIAELIVPITQVTRTGKCSWFPRARNRRKERSQSPRSEGEPEKAKFDIMLSENDF